MTLLKYYLEHIYKTSKTASEEQTHVVLHYQQLLENILNERLDTQKHNSQKRKIWDIFSLHLINKHKKKSNTAPLAINRGIYVWGTVGTGKTFLMDLFFNYVDLPKSRYHYYHFMRLVHDQLHELKGQEDPLISVAGNLAMNNKIIFLDEFFVTDITDAMLLAKLISALFDAGVYLVMTSNCTPESLYKNGLQRARFLPTIDLINQQMKVVTLKSAVDYRLQYLANNLAHLQVWHILESRDKVLINNREILQKLFTKLNEQDEIKINEQIPILINDRALEVLNVSDNTLHCHFNALCQTARNAADYIEVAKIYSYVLIEEIPVLDSLLENEARRFITLIDEFYDRGIKIAVTAACPINQLYQGEKLVFEFERTTSRLIEMQSKEYLIR